MVGLNNSTKWPKSINLICERILVKLLQIKFNFYQQTMIFASFDYGLQHEKKIQKICSGHI